MITSISPTKSPSAREMPESLGDRLSARLGSFVGGVFVLPFPGSLMVLETSAGCWSGALAASSKLRLRASGPMFPMWDLSSTGDVTGVNEKQREALPPGVLLLGV